MHGCHAGLESSPQKDLGPCAGASRTSVADDDGSSSGAAGTTSSSGDVITGGSSGTPGGSSGGPTCATASATTTREPIYLDIVLDHSASMDGYAEFTAATAAVCVGEAPSHALYCQHASASQTDPLDSERRTGKKWIAARGALKAFFDAKGAQASTQLAVGMLLVDDMEDEDNPNRLDIRWLDSVQAAALWGPIAPPRYPVGATPLLSSVQSSIATLKQFVPSGPLAVGGRRAMLLIADGVPSADGASCDALKADPSGKVDIVIGCPTGTSVVN